MEEKKSIITLDNLLRHPLPNRYGCLQNPIGIIAIGIKAAPIGSGYLTTGIQVEFVTGHKQRVRDKKDRCFPLSLQQGNRFTCFSL